MNNHILRDQLVDKALDLLEDFIVGNDKALFGDSVARDSVHRHNLRFAWRPIVSHIVTALVRVNWDANLLDRKKLLDGTGLIEADLLVAINKILNLKETYNAL